MVPHTLLLKEPGPRTDKRDLSVTPRPANGLKGRESHDRIPEPVGEPYQDPIDQTGLKRRHGSPD